MGKKRKSKKKQKIFIENLPKTSDENVYIMNDAQRGYYIITDDDLRRYELEPKERVDNKFGSIRFLYLYLV